MGAILLPLAAPVVIALLTVALIVFNRVKFPPRKNKIDQVIDFSITVAAWCFYLWACRILILAVFNGLGG